MYAYDRTGRVQATLRRLMELATKQAVKSALQHGIDMPVGAVATRDDIVIGKGFASDKRTKDDWLHAEWMALAYADLYQPDVLGVTMEPCPRCQRRIASQESIKLVVFNVDRATVAARGLVRAHGSSIFDNLSNLPYEVMQYSDPVIDRVNSVILDHAHRNPEEQTVSVERFGLLQELSRSEITSPFVPSIDVSY